MSYLESKNLRAVTTINRVISYSVSKNDEGKAVLSFTYLDDNMNPVGIDISYDLRKGPNFIEWDYPESTLRTEVITSLLDWLSSNQEEINDLLEND